MGADAFLDTPRRVRVVLWTGAAVITALILALMADATVGLGSLSAPLLRWSPSAASVVAATSASLRVGTVERERRAWAPLALGLLAYSVAWIWWTVVWSTDADAPMPSPADALWLLIYPAAYATAAMLLRRSFVRAPASMWLDGLLAAMAFSAVGVALIYAPLIHKATGPAFGVAVQAAYPLGDMLLAALVLGVVAVSGWRPGARWIVIGVAVLSWFIGDTINLNNVAGGGGGDASAGNVFWCVGFLLLTAAPWLRASTPEGLRVEGLRMLLAPAVFSTVALAVLAYDQVHRTNAVTVVLALGAVGVALARTTMTLREIQLLADARHESLTDELTGLPTRRHFHRRLDAVLREAEAEDLPFALLASTWTASRSSTTRSATARATRCCSSSAAACRRTSGAAAPGPPRRRRVRGAPDRPGGPRSRAAGRRPRASRRSSGRSRSRASSSTSASASASRCYPDHATEDGELLRRADVAMYLAKGAGGGVALYDPERDLHTRDRLALGRQLRAGLERDELEIYYQPKVDPQLGRVLGVEALVRWQHPVHGLLMPPATSSRWPPARA